MSWPDIGALALGGAAAGDYALGNDTCSSQTVAPATSCTFEVGFTPSATGARVGQVSIPSNAPSSPDTVGLGGSGVLTVGGAVSGLSGSGLVLQNNGGDDLAIAADGAFTFANALADGSGYAVTVATQPTSPIQTCNVANGSGTLARADVTDVLVTCLEEPPGVGLSAGALDLGLVLQGESATGSVAVTNIGTGELIISELVEPGAPFSITGGTCALLPLTLLPGEGCDIETAFMPVAAGAFVDELTIISNAPSSPDTVTLLGNGEGPAILEVPTLDRYGQLLLALLIAGFAVRFRRPSAV